MRWYRSGMRWCVWRWTHLDYLGARYMTRLHVLQTPLFAVMLHWFHGPDPHPDPHDHPVAFLSLVLRGSYVERRWPRDSVYPKRRRIRWLNWARPRDVHRIVTVINRPVTLVLAGPVVRQWGFHTRAGWIHWRDYRSR